jgi:hypothetical protein
MASRRESAGAQAVEFRRRECPSQRLLVLDKDSAIPRQRIGCLVPHAPRSTKSQFSLAEGDQRFPASKQAGLSKLVIVRRASCNQQVLRIGRRSTNDSSLGFSLRSKLGPAARIGFGSRFVLPFREITSCACRRTRGLFPDAFRSSCSRL